MVCLPFSLRTKSVVAALLLLVASSCKKAPDADAGDEGRLLRIDNEKVRTTGGEFSIYDPQLSEWLTETRKKAGGENAALRLDIDRETFWVHIAHIITLARKSGWERIAIRGTEAQQPAPGNPQKPLSFIVQLAQDSGGGTISVRLPEVLPWKAAFQRVQSAAYSRQPVLFEVLRANRQIPTIPEK